MKLLQMHELLKEEDVILGFNGTLTQTIVTSLVESLEAELLSADVDKKLIHNAFTIITEQMQNIMSYSKDRIERHGNNFESTGCVLVAFDKEKEKYYISSSNKIKEGDEKVLKEKISYLNSLDEVALKRHYKEQRKSGKDKHERGAGLGFIMMAKSSSEDIECEIKEIDISTSLFMIKIYL